MVTVTLDDGTGSLDLTFFNQPWTASLYEPGQELAVSGVVPSCYRARLQLANQEVELLRGDEQDLVHTGRITPVHPAAEGITTRTIRELVWRALERLPTIAGPAAGRARRRRGARRLRRGDPADPLPRGRTRQLARGAASG